MNNSIFLKFAFYYTDGCFVTTRITLNGMNIIGTQTIMKYLDMEQYQL